MKTIPQTRTRLPGAHRILVVDDQPDWSYTLAVLLGMQGLEVVFSGPPGDALAAGDRLRPTVVVIDPFMDSGGGLRLCMAMRERDWGARALVVVVSGWLLPRHYEAALAAGADHYLAKPLCDLRRLTDLLRFHPADRHGLCASEA